MAEELIAADPSTAQSTVRELVQRYEAIRRSGQDRSYNEARTVNELILPLFQALGWDVHNQTGRDEVLPEVQASRGRVDWAFRIRGVPRLFLEAKKLSADLDNPDHARQAINYAYNKNVTWAALTDFAGLRVYNAEWHGPNPNVNLFLDLTHDQYESEFERLWWLSRPSFEAGVLDREASRVGRKLKKTPVGERLFSDLLIFRGMLRDYFRAYNEKVDSVELDQAVQRLLDRLIFIRTAEDRGVEPNHLRSLLRGLEATHKRATLWDELLRLFREFDAGYDSQLFSKQLLDRLVTEVEPIRVVIEGLYGSRDRAIEYDFSAIDADVLGGVYEQYLGQLAKAPPVSMAKLSVAQALRERARSDTKPFRKAHGVYYTPKWVVRFIADQTLGHLLRVRSPEEVRELHILDPACGSGSFLVEAFGLLDAYWAAQEPPRRPADVRDRRVRILRENIFGVDLDPQAVEIAQLNLLLVALDQRELLPDLARNIVVANSLLEKGPSEQWFGEPPATAIDWRRLSPGGDGLFDVVIANPPYIRAEAMDRQQRDYFMQGGAFHPVGRFDIFALFMELGLCRLKPGGRLGYIVPSALATQNYGEWLRRELLTRYRLDGLADLRDIDVFPGVAVEPIIVLASSDTPEATIDVTRPGNPAHPEELGLWTTTHVGRSDFLAMPRAMFRLSFREGDERPIAALERSGLTLDRVCYCITGFVAHDSATGASKDRLLTDDLTDPRVKPYLEAKEVREPFAQLTPSRHILYAPEMMHRPKFAQLFDRPKILVQRVTGRQGLRASVDRAGIYVNHSFDCVVRYCDLDGAPSYARGDDESRRRSSAVSLDALAVVLNSPVMSEYFQLKQGTDMDATPASLRALPLPPLETMKEGSRLARLGAQVVAAKGDRRAALLAEVDVEVRAAYGPSDSELSPRPTVD